MPEPHPRTAAARIMAVAAAALVAALLPDAAAYAAWSSSTETVSTARVPEAVELSGLVASPTQPGWYWAQSDVWKTTDAPAACAGLTDQALARCQQVQRSRLWALRLDPVTHKVVDYRSFALSNPSWALQPTIAQDNDWEDLSLGPTRSDGRAGLVIAATGNAERNPVLDANGRNITCDTRRLIELPEPDLSDPTVTTWTPTEVFDLANPVGVGGLSSCNFETLVVGPDGSGQPTAFLVSRGQRKLFTRSLAVSSGRDPAAPVPAVGSTDPAAPRITYAGAVKDATGTQFTAGDASGGAVTLLAHKTSTLPCRLFSWSAGSGGLAAALTQRSPAITTVTCGGGAEGLAYARGGTDPGVVTDDLVAVSDTAGSSTFTSWYLPSR